MRCLSRSERSERVIDRVSELNRRKGFSLFAVLLPVRNGSGFPVCCVLLDW